jgi:hypothetical protein
MPLFTRKPKFLWLDYLSTLSNEYLSYKFYADIEYWYDNNVKFLETNNVISKEVQEFINYKNFAFVAFTTLFEQAMTLHASSEDSTMDVFNTEMARVLIRVFPKLLTFCLVVSQNSKWCAGTKICFPSADINNLCAPNFVQIQELFFTNTEYMSLAHQLLNKFTDIPPQESLFAESYAGEHLVSFALGPAYNISTSIASGIISANSKLTYHKGNLAFMADDRYTMSPNAIKENWNPYYNLNTGENITKEEYEASLEPQEQLVCAVPQSMYGALNGGGTKRRKFTKLRKLTKGRKLTKRRKLAKRQKLTKRRKSYHKR